MVFVTVGSTDNDFRRLLIEVDRLIEKGELEDVHAQIGNSSYVPLQAESFRFAPYDKVFGMMEKADLVIAHAGTGTLNMALGLRKATIAVARRTEYGEHPDNHQVELSQLLDQQGRVIGIVDAAALESAVARLADWTPTFRESNAQTELLLALRETIELLLYD